ncbi:MAG TPA: UvrD-helicase domain-containing protein [Gemmataceae bacterium]|nr:UvrD-helicase domain-containing protein [Gemmataceae bacterium]
MSEPTPQQQAAIARRGTSVVLSSGAGCGKTFVLTNRYLSHLKQDGVGVSQIVAITFTDRAAREMRDRIRQAVAAQLRARPDDSSWADHLRDLESAPIQTIHSFCGDLLRQFAVPAGLDPRFEVLEEILAENLRVEALQDTLRALLTADTPAGRDLGALVVLYGWTATVDAVQALLRERDAAGWDRWLRRSPADIAAEWTGSERQDLLLVWVTYLCAASPKIAHLVNLFRGTECRGPEMRVNVQKVLEGLPRLAAAPDLGTAVEELCEAAKVGREKADAWPDSDTYAAVRDAMADFRKELTDKLALFSEEPEEVERAAVVGQRFLRVALTVVEAYQERKTRAGVVDFQDLLVLARDLLRDRSEVRESLRHRYRYLLLDEMQDTDPVQMELVELLCGVGLEHDKLFAVGDAKQSIYRFRGAEVALFEKLRSAVGLEGRLQLTRNYRSHPGILHFVNALCSHRFPDYEPLEPHHPPTYPGPCVEFLWSVPAAEDSPLSHRFGGRGAGGEGGQGPRPEETASGPGKPNPPHPDPLPPKRGERENAADVRSREADAIARRIAEVIDSPEARVRDGDSLRPVTPGDVVLLFRSMSNVGIYEAALRKHGLDYYLVGGRAFFAQQEVYDLLNLLRALENPSDSVALAGTLRSPFGCLSDDALLLLAIHPRGLWSGLHDPECVAGLPDDQRPRAERIRGLLDEWRPLKDRLAIARLINRVVADTGYDAALQFEFLGDRKLANLWKLIDLARSFDRSGLFGLAEFIARLGELVDTQPREEQAATQPENADVVRIMSIHQAKGLEFPVVFVPDLAARGLGGRLAAARWDRRLGCIARPPTEDPPLFTDFPHRLAAAAETVAEWREDLRILYVACTRARDLLVLSAGLTDSFPAGTAADRPVPVKAPNTWMLALGERFHLVSGNCLDATIPADQRPAVAVRVVEPAVGQPPRAGRSEDEPRAEIRPGSFAPIAPRPWPAVVWLGDLERAAEPTPAARRFREALSRWDASGKPPEFPDNEAQALWDRFAVSEWPARLRAAERLYRELEFLAPWPGGGSSHDRPVLRGVIDFLWKEPDGWHLLALDTGEGRADGARRFEALVVRGQFTEPVVSATTLELQIGVARRLDGPGLEPEAIEQEMEALLVRIAKLAA